MRAFSLSLVFLSIGVAPTARAQPGETSIIVVSQPGDPVGGGRTTTLTAEDGRFGAYRRLPNGVTIGFTGSGTDWILEFTAPQGADLIPGRYEGAVRPVGEDSPALNVTSEGRGCNNICGRFEIEEVVLGQGTEVERFAASFEQHCECGVPALSGTVRFNAIGPGGQVPGDCDQDGSVGMADALCVFEALFLGRRPPAACGEPTVENRAYVALLDWQADARLDISDGIALLMYLHFGGPPHQLQADGEPPCVFVPGCEAGLACA
jgi:hypothetical protein